MWRILHTLKTKIWEKYNLTLKTLTIDYADMLLPITKHMQGKKWTLSFQQYSQWENMKESLEVSVPDGVCYQEFKTFNPQDTHQNVGLYISHVIST